MTGSRRRPVVPPTRDRKWIDPRSRMPPKSMVDHTGQPWAGTSRIVDRAGRRHTNRLSWRRLKAEGRRTFVASTRENVEEEVAA